MSGQRSEGTKLIFACSGAADVGAVADQAARRLSREGAGRMYCLAGVGGRVAGVLKTTAAAESILAIDGCPQSCGMHSLQQAGFTNFTHLQLGEIGLEKGKTPPTDAAVATVVAHARKLLTAGPRG